ncbi:hypothetical protein C8T65DRAFT_587606 [Cerioporus squamosus]|nr:hypothetical protein C8T65DRAFT_587606 [Cerioporus squamosus]
MHNMFLGELRHHCMDIFKLGHVRETPKRTAAVHTPIEQQAQLDRILRYLKGLQANRLADMRKDYLLAVARYNQVFVSGKDPTRRHIADALVKWVRLPIRAIRLPPVLDKPTNTFTLPGEAEEEEYGTEYRLFDHAAREQLRRDIVHAVVPSWVEKPPSNIGEASHGKLKADQWRTLCTIFMVLTLVPLWGHASATAEQRAVLENFVSLIVAVDAATRRSMTPARADLFDRHMENYVKGLRTLFNHKLTPNHHLSLHLKDCLLLFGPVHGWWSYPFERLNGLLQRFNTNHKPDTIPMTFMRYFYMGAGLRWLVSNITWPDEAVYKDWMTSFLGAFKEATRGTRFSDLASFLSSADKPFEYNKKRQEALPRPLYDQLYRLLCPELRNPKFQSGYVGKHTGVPLLPTDAQYVHSVQRGGLLFCTQTHGHRNSFIIFRHPSTGEMSAGSIQHIFYHRRREMSTKVVEPFVVIRPYVQLSEEHQALDPFQAFPDLDTKLYYDELSSPLVIRLSDVVCHFAALTYTPDDIGKPCIIARSLDRVSSFCLTFDPAMLMKAIGVIV